ncbi:MAG: hypothetical protein ACM3SY_15400 [Candidatus Omnitrophota bacterium]
MKMIHRRFFLLCLVCVAAAGWIGGMTGCITAAANKNYYQLHIPLKEGCNIPKEYMHKIAWVQMPDVDDIYNDYRMVYRESPFRLNYYSYEFWIKKPDLMLREEMVHYLKRQKAFANVIEELTQGRPDLMVKTTVYALEEYDYKRYDAAHLKMSIEAADVKTGKRIVKHEFDRQTKLAQRKLKLLPPAISRMIEEELDVFIKKLEYELSTR